MRGVAAPPRQRGQQRTKTKGRPRERERGGAEAELPGLVGALPRELKRNALSFASSSCERREVCLRLASSSAQAQLRL